MFAPVIVPTPEPNQKLTLTLDFLPVSCHISTGLEEWNVGLPVLEVFCNLTPMTAGSALPAFRFELRYKK